MVTHFCLSFIIFHININVCVWISWWYHITKNLLFFCWVVWGWRVILNFVKVEWPTLITVMTREIGRCVWHVEVLPIKHAKNWIWKYHDHNILLLKEKSQYQLITKGTMGVISALYNFSLKKGIFCLHAPIYYPVRMHSSKPLKKDHLSSLHSDINSIG